MSGTVMPMDESQRLAALNEALSTFEPKGEVEALMRVLGHRHPSAREEAIGLLKTCNEQLWRIPADEFSAICATEKIYAFPPLSEPFERLLANNSMHHDWDALSQPVKFKEVLDPLRTYLVSTFADERSEALKQLEVLIAKDPRGVKMAIKGVRRRLKPLWKRDRLVFERILALCKAQREKDLQKAKWFLFILGVFIVVLYAFLFNS